MRNAKPVSSNPKERRGYSHSRRIELEKMEHTYMDGGGGGGGGGGVKDHQADRSVIKCFKCNEMRHKSNECRRRPYRPNSTSNDEENNYFAEEKTKKANHAWATDSMSRRCIESGGTAHMCKEALRIIMEER